MNLWLDLKSPIPVRMRAKGYSFRKNSIDTLCPLLPESHSR